MSRTADRRIPLDVLQLLADGTCTGSTFRLPAGQLDRARYQAVNAVLEALGARWSKKDRGHVFAVGAAADRVGMAVATGSYADPKQLAFFATPPALARELVERADVRRGMQCLEPSAGEGAIVRQLVDVVGTAFVLAYEIDAERSAKVNKQWPGVCVCHDFLLTNPAPLFDRIVMNPPFSLPGVAQADVEHVKHAVRFLKPDGVLVAIMGAGIEWRSNVRSVRFRERFRPGIERLPESSFRSSGTDVNAVVVTICRGDLQ